MRLKTIFNLTITPMNPAFTFNQVHDHLTVMVICHKTTTTEIAEDMETCILALKVRAG